ncbi:MAG TPA: acyltransferase, partial [Anaerolineales bacterium]
MTDIQVSRKRSPRDLPLIHRLSNLLLDGILAHLRILLFPFKLLTVLAKWTSALIWELSNEYTKRAFASCGTGVRLHGPFHVTAPRNLHIGNNVHINSNAFLRAEGGISIGDHTHISRNLTVYSMNHNYTGELLPYDSTSVWKPVKIGRNVWIGMNVSI